MRDKYIVDAFGEVANGSFKYSSEEDAVQKYNSLLKRTKVYSRKNSIEFIESENHGVRLLEACKEGCYAIVMFRKSPETKQEELEYIATRLEKSTNAFEFTLSRDALDDTIQMLREMIVRMD